MDVRTIHFQPKKSKSFFWYLWRFLRGISLIIFAVVIMVSSVILWPVYLGIIVLCPRFAAYILSRDIF